MADFGKAKYTTSKFGTSKLVVWDSLHHANYQYHFSVKNRAKGFWKCVKCDCLSNAARRRHEPAPGKVPLLKIDEGEIIRSDPDHPTNPHFCQPIPRAVGIAQETDKTARSVADL